MSTATKGKIAAVEQPASFEFTPENFATAGAIAALIGVAVARRDG